MEIDKNKQKRAQISIYSYSKLQYLDTYGFSRDRYVELA